MLANNFVRFVKITRCYRPTIKNIAKNKKVNKLLETLLKFKFYFVAGRQNVVLKTIAKNRMRLAKLRLFYKKWRLWSLNSLLAQRYYSRKNSFYNSLAKIKIINKISKKLFPKTLQTSGRVLIWNTNLPIKYFNAGKYYSIVKQLNNVIIQGNKKYFNINKKIYGGLVIMPGVWKTTDNDKIGVPYFFHRTSTGAENSVSNTTKENRIIKLYITLFLKSQKGIFVKKPYYKLKIVKKIQKNEKFEHNKRGYIKHMVRLRYRWFFRPKFKKFRLFKKILKRTLKRFRKIKKNRLFLEKFRRHFSRLTGFKEKAMFKMWLPLRRNYNQYWSVNNAVSRFSQSLVLTPANFLVFLKISPSLAASKHLVKSGGISINGLSVNNFISLKPGDILQLNMTAWKAVRNFFSYQSWTANFQSTQQIPFLYIDWSSLLFFILRWPQKHELMAPSFLSERWLRYYIRLFPAKTGKFKQAKNKFPTYKEIIAKK